MLQFSLVKKFRYPLFSLFILGSLLFSVELHASSREDYTFSNLTFGLGNMNRSVGKTQSDTDGNKRWLEFLPTINLSMNYHLTGDLDFELHGGTSLPETGEDPSIKKLTFYLLSNLIIHYEAISIKLGTGLYFTRISSRGGSVTLNNGDGMTDFPLPQNAVYSRNMIANLGVRAYYDSDTYFDLDGFALDLTDSLSRSFTLLFTINFNFQPEDI